MILKIHPPRDNERGPFYVESAIAAFHALPEVELEIRGGAFYVHCRDEDERAVENAMYAQYPDCEIVRESAEGTDPARDFEHGSIPVRLAMTDPVVFPIKRHPQFDDLLARVNADPIAALLASGGTVRIALRPLPGSFRRRCQRLLPMLERGLCKLMPLYAVFFSRVMLARGWRRIAVFPLYLLMGGFRSWFAKRDGQATARSHDKEAAFTGAEDKCNKLLFEATVTVSQQCDFRQFSLPNSNSLAPGRGPVVFSIEEIATLWHLPTLLVQVPGIQWVQSRKLEPPKDTKGLLLGRSPFRGEEEEIRISDDARARHLYLCGKTGMGKSTMLENMIFSDIDAGMGVGLIDPHGDLCDSVLSMIPKERSNDVVIFDPADLEFPLSFNVLASPRQQHLVCSGIIAVFERMWPDVWSGRMEYILRNTLLALLEYKKASLLGVLRMYSDKDFRKAVVEEVTDPVVKAFWTQEYAGWTERYRVEAIAAIQNKVGQLVSTPLIRNIIGQSKSRLDIRTAMDRGQIIIANLSKGKLGEDVSSFLGSMLVTKFQIDAMSRADTKERRPFHLYVDEVQNFASKSFGMVLSEARKYGLALTLANQFLSQFDEETGLQDAIFGNVGSMAIFQVGAEDAEFIERQFGEVVTVNDLVNLPKYHAYMKLLIDGMPGQPFMLRTLPPPDRPSYSVDRLRGLSRSRFAQPRAEVEERIAAWYRRSF